MIRSGFAYRAITASTLLATTMFAVDLLGAGVARAGDCNSDIAGLSQKRQVYIEKLNVLAKASKGKLDPVSSCPQLKGLVKTEGDLLRYLETNKNWCNVPDDTVTNLKAADSKSQAFATQACSLASQAAKQKQEAASGGGALGLQAQKLPTGPL